MTRSLDEYAQRDNWYSTRFGGLGIMLYGVLLTVVYQQIAALFIMMAIAVGFVNRIPANEFVTR